LPLAAWWAYQQMNDKNNWVQVKAEMAMQQVVLEDSTKVFLRKGAILSYPTHFAFNKRSVTLSGEGFFEVTRNEQKPFTIQAQQTTVAVLGTSFTVNANLDSVSVIVKTGKVSVAANSLKEKLVLLPAEKGVCVNGKLQKQLNTDSNVYAWQTGVWVFEKTNLKEVITVINKNFGVHIAIDASVAAIIEKTTITNTFHHTSAQNMLEEIALITGFEIKKMGNTEYIITTK
jgi:transmembrane sensor